MCGGYLFETQRSLYPDGNVMPDDFLVECPFALWLSLLLFLFWCWRVAETQINCRAHLHRKSPPSFKWLERVFTTTKDQVTCSKVPVNPLVSHASGDALLPHGCVLCYPVNTRRLGPNPHRVRGRWLQHQYAWSLGTLSRVFRR